MPVVTVTSPGQGNGPGPPQHDHVAASIILTGSTLSCARTRALRVRRLAASLRAGINDSTTVTATVIVHCQPASEPEHESLIMIMIMMS